MLEVKKVEHKAAKTIRAAFDVAKGPNANSQQRATALWSLVTLAQQHLLSKVSLEDQSCLKMAAITLAYQVADDINADSQSKANSLWNLGKLTQEGLLYKLSPDYQISLKMVAITLAYQVALDINADSKSKANSLWSLGKLAQKGLLYNLSPDYQISLKMAAITLAYQVAADTTANSQGNANSLWGLGRLADFLSGLSSTDHFYFLEAVITLAYNMSIDTTANSQERANSLWGLAKLDENDLLYLYDLYLYDLYLYNLSSKYLTNLATYATRLASDVSVDPSAEAQSKANSLWGLAKLAEKGLLSYLSPENHINLETAVIILAYKLSVDSEANAQSRANSLWSLGKLAEKNWLPNLLSEKNFVFFENNQKPAGSLLEKATKSLSSLKKILAAKSLSSLKEISHEYENQSDLKNTEFTVLSETPNLLAQIAITLAADVASDSKTNFQHNSSSLWGLGKLAEKNLLWSESSEYQITFLRLLKLAVIKILDNVAGDFGTNSQSRANSLCGLTKIAKKGLLSELSPSYQYNLEAFVTGFANSVKDDNLNATSQHRANTLWALVTLIEKDLLLSTDVKTAIVFIALELASKIGSDPNANYQEIANSLWTLAKLAKKGVLSYLLPKEQIDLEIVVITLSYRVAVNTKNNPQEIARTLDALQSFNKKDFLSEDQETSIIEITTSPLEKVTNTLGGFKSIAYQILLQEKSSNDYKITNIFWPESNSDQNRSFVNE